MEDTQLSTSASARTSVPGDGAVHHQSCCPCCFNDSLTDLQGQEDELINTQQNNVNGNAKRFCCCKGVDQAAREFVRRAKHQLRYSCCFNDFVEDLRKQKNKLVETQKGVDKCLKDSKTQAINLPVVRAWLMRHSYHLKGNVEKLLKEVDTRTNKSRCLVLRCPNWIWRYQIAKKLAKINVEVRKCIEEGAGYAQVEDLVSLPYTEDLPPKSLKFDSRAYAYEKLLEALKDDTVSMIGLHGMGGCGKTTMAMELKTTDEAKYLFDEVHFVTVSNNFKVEVRSIQDTIARAVQLPLKGDEESDKRAKDLCTRLTLEHKRILLILDDVWQELDFGAIGIPFGKNCKNCKVLITTRSGGICAAMKCQRKIPLSILTDEEAWGLFRMQAHISKSTSNSIKRLAKQISDECKGLPVAIVALAGTLKGKVEDDWNAALNTLKKSIPVVIEKKLKNPYKCLRVSYDNLDTEEAKSLFLLCAVFPEDFEIPVKNLTIFAIGLGLVGEIQLFKEARDKVSSTKEKLIDSSLLLDANEGKCVKMHDLVREVALQIAREENKVVTCLLEKDVTLECNLSRYLWCTKFSNELNFDCSSIEFLHIETYSEVPDEIFKGMESLRVLFLCWEDWNDGSLSTTSFKSLTNLRCLFLDSWELGDISSVRHMAKLESLVLHKCSFFELPDVIVTELTNLRLLEFSECRMERNPFEVIGGYPRLEELYFYEGEPSNGVGSEWYFDLGDRVDFFEKFSVPQSLQRYQIQLGDNMKIREHTILNGHNTLALSCLDTSTSNAAVLDFAKKAEVLQVANIEEGGKSIIPDIFKIEEGRAINYGWIELVLCDSKEIECLVDTSNYSLEIGTLFSKLRKLRLKRMEHLGALNRGVPRSGLFEKLEQLHISECSALEFIFPTTFVEGSFEKLEQLSIEECSVLTYLFTPATARSLAQLEKLEVSSCGELKHIVADDNDAEDVKISIQDDRKSMLSKLKDLHISECSALEGIFPTTFAEGSFEKLEQLSIEECTVLTYLFTPATARSLAQLENLKVWSCGELKHIVADDDDTEDVKVSRQDKSMLSKLKDLSIKECSALEGIFPTTFAEGSFEKLEQLSIRGCSLLTYLFTPATARSLAQLENLAVSSCGELKHIVADDDDAEDVKISRQDKSMLSKLKDLSIKECSALEGIFPTTFDEGSFEKLEQLSIGGCSLLTYLFTPATARSLAQLENLEVSSCGELKHIVADDDDAEDVKISRQDDRKSMLSKLKDLIIWNCSALEGIFPTTFAEGSFEKLEQLSIGRCSLLTYLFTPATARSLAQLEKLKVWSCGELKHIVADDDDTEDVKVSRQDKSMLSKLKDLSIKECSALEGIFPTTFAEGSFEKLEQLSIRGCSLLTYLFTPATARSLAQLEKLKVWSCGELKHIVADDDDTEDVKVSRQDKSMFSKLKILSIKECSALEGIFPTTFAEGSFEKLEQLSIEECTVLTYLFTPATARSLAQLEKLKLWSCGELKHIVADDDDTEDVKVSRQDKSMLSKLKDLSIKECSALEGIFPTTFAEGSFEKLEQLFIEECTVLAYLFTPATARSLAQLEKLIVWSCGELKHIVADDDDTEDVKVSRQDKSMLSKLKDLSIKECSALEGIFPTTFAEGSFEKLEQLSIKECSVLTYLFTPATARSLAQLEKLKLWSCGELKHIVADDDDTEDVKVSRQDKSMLSKLKILSIKECSALEGIFPITFAEGSFEKLEQLFIEECTVLTYLFTPATARSLAQLEKFKVRSCGELKHIVADDDDAEDVKISRQDDRKSMLSKLKDLSIFKCPNLKCLYVSASNELPNLEFLMIEGASKLEELISCEHGQGDEIGKVEVMLPKLKFLVLHHLPSLSQGIELPTLTARLVHDCPQFSLTSSFSTLHEFERKLDELYEGGLLSWGTRHLALEDIISTYAITQSIERGNEEGATPHNGEILTLSTHSESTSPKPAGPSSVTCQQKSYPHGIEDEIKESVEDGSTLEDTMKASIPAGTEGNNGLGAVVVTNTKAGTSQCQKMQNIDDSIQEGSNLIVSKVENSDRSGIQKPLGETGSTIEILQSIKNGNEGGGTSHNTEILTLSTHSGSASPHPYPYPHSIEGMETTTIGEVPALVKPTLPTFCSELTIPLHKIYSRIYFNLKLVGQESTMEPSLLYQRHELGETTSIGDNIIESFQEGSISEEITKATIPNDAEGNALVVVSTIQKLLGEIDGTTEISQSIEGAKTTIFSEAQASMKTILPTIGSELATPLHKIPSSKLVDQESTIEPSLLDQRHEVGETISIEEDKKESVQDVSISEDTAKAAMAADTEGNGLPVLAVTLTETGTLQSQVMQNVDDSIQEGFNLMDKEDASSCHSLIVAELGAFKHSAGLNDAQIALLDEAIAVYPHLWKGLDKFSTHFQALMLKTLADMLFFLRNESAASVTPQRENEFLKLCDVAVQLGFDKSWVDEMRQRVMVNRRVMVNELLQMRDQLTQEICKMKDKIDNIDNFVDSQKKCFDFL